MTSAARSETIEQAVNLLEAAGDELAAGLADSSLDKAGRAARILEARCGADHPDVANAHLAVGAAQESLGDFGAAALAYRRAMATMDGYVDRLGDDQALARLLVQSHTAVGTIERILGSLDVAHATLSSAVELAELLLGEHDSDTGWALNALGIVCKYAGSFAEGAEHYRRALAVVEINEGPGSVAAAAIWHNIAGLAFDAGDYDAALEPARRAVDLHEATLGPDHPTVASDIAALAAILDCCGEHTEANALNQRALTILESAAGSEYDLAVLHNNLGVAAAGRGETVSAEGHYRQALLIKERLLGPDHPDVAMTIHNIGALAAARGDNTRALELLGRALTIFVSTLGPEHDKTVRCRDAIKSVGLLPGDP